MAENIEINVTENGDIVEIIAQPNLYSINVTRGLILFNVVTTVNGETGDVVITKATVGLSNVDNTSDVNKPISSATQSALNAKYDASNPSGFITFSALSSYVPYTGASQNLNLGSKNLIVNNIFDGFSSITASATQVVLTVDSVPSYLVSGSGGQTIKLPNATTLQNGTVYIFNNNQSSGVITINNNSNTLIVSVPSGGYALVELIDNTTSAGSWDRHFQAPSNVSWSTNTFDYAGSITSATWNGNVVAINRGGTGASTASAALTNLGGQPLLNYTPLKYLLRSTYALMIADGTPTVNTLYTVTNDENKNYVRSTYLWRTDGNREWIASTPDN
jgi:hypothetical protein